MDFSNRDYPYYIFLVILGAIIAYVSTLKGGMPILLGIGVVVSLFIGYRSTDTKMAVLTGAFFGIIIATVNSPIMNGYFDSADPLTAVFIPYFINAAIAAAIAGAVSFAGYKARRRPY